MFSILAAAAALRACLAGGPRYGARAAEDGTLTMEDRVCGICQNDDEEGLLRVDGAGRIAEPFERCLNEGHVYHRACAEPWLDNPAHGCPECRGQMEGQVRAIPMTEYGSLDWEFAYRQFQGVLRYNERRRDEGLPQDAEAFQQAARLYSEALADDRSEDSIALLEAEAHAIEA